MRKNLTGIAPSKIPECPIKIFTPEGKLFEIEKPYFPSFT